MLQLATGILKNPGVYIAVQHALQAHRSSYECLTAAGVEPGHRVLDVGCGPAYYFDAFPDGIDYVGYDTDADYIAWARARYGARGRFHVDTYTEAHRASQAPFDRVLLLGLLHHLDDDAAEGLLALAARSLRSGGVVVTLDPCFDPALFAYQNWFAANDRGRYVRTARAFEKLAGSHFAAVRGQLVDGRYIPVRQWMMRLEARP